MKRIVDIKWVLIALLMFSLTTVYADAQRYGQTLTCIGDNVNVRTGPGKNHKVKIIWAWDMDRERDIYVPLQLFRGDTVKYLGKKRNGFLYIAYSREEEGGEWVTYKGWVSARYLR